MLEFMDRYCIPKSPILRLPLNTCIRAECTPYLKNEVLASDQSQNRITGIQILIPR